MEVPVKRLLTEAAKDFCQVVLVCETDFGGGIGRGHSGAQEILRASVEAFRTEREESLRARCGSMDRAALRELPVYREYAAYYRLFDKTCHVLMQLESIALKGKHIPTVSNLVTAMFTAELSSGVLTAGHDLDLLDLPLDVSPLSRDAVKERLDILTAGE